MILKDAGFNRRRLCIRIGGGIVRAKHIHQMRQIGIGETFLRMDGDSTVIVLVCGLPIAEQDIIVCNAVVEVVVVILPLPQESGEERHIGIRLLHK